MNKIVTQTTQNDKPIFVMKNMNDGCGYTPINLGKIIKEGVLADIQSIHRMMIDKRLWNEEDIKYVYGRRWLY